MNTAITRALACAALVTLWALHRPAPPDLSSPKATVHTFVDALMAKDAAALIACVQGAKDARSLNTLLEGNRRPLRYDIKEMIVELHDDGAKVAIEAEVLGDGGDSVEKTLLVDLLTLKKEGEIWRIVPDTALLKNIAAGDTAQTRRLNERSLKIMAAIVGDADLSARAMIIAKQKEETNACLSNGKQIARGLIMYQQDYDETYPRKKAAYDELIAPYVRNKAVFHCPLDPPGTISYAFNKNLEGIANAAVSAPASAIMLYEGKDMKPNYRHNGKAVIVFADGHAKLCTPDMVRQFSWLPAGSPNAPDAPTVSPDVDEPPDSPAPPNPKPPQKPKKKPVR